MSIIRTDFSNLNSQNSEYPIVTLANIKFSEAQLVGGIYKVNEGVTFTITADMLSPLPELVLPAGEMTPIVEKMVRGVAVNEMPFTATITAADGEIPARLTLPLKLPAGFYKIDPERLNLGLSNPKINAPFRLAFEPVDIDCLGVVE